jgi:uncharacterized protein YndB with AHSA1/START domain
VQGQVEIEIAATPARVYALVSDITRYGEWSPENLGGRWLEGATGAIVGARFRAKNKRKLSWSTTCRVRTAEAGREFSFGVGKRGETVWGYRIEPIADGAGSRVTEWFTSEAQPGAVERLLIRLVTGMSLEARSADLVQGMQTTLARLKAAAEAA